MKHTATLILSLMSTGCVHRGDPRLSGTFVSDKTATLAYLASTGSCGTNQLLKLGELFGKLEVTYDGTTVTTTLDGYTDRDKLRIIDSGSNHVTIATQLETEELLGEVILVTNRIEFTSDGYWITTSMVEPPFREKFVRKEHPAHGSCRRRSAAATP